MVGLGETCSHIAAVLSYLEAVHWFEGKKRKLDQSLEGVIPEESKVTVKEGSRPIDDDFSLYLCNIICR